MKTKVSSIAFTAFNYILLAFLALICVVPFIHLIAVSFSQNAAVAAGLVRLWPVQFTTFAYEFVLSRHQFWTAFGVTIQRVLIGGTLNMVLVLLTAYPLSKESSRFKSRTIYVWYFFLAFLIARNLIPIFLLLNNLNLLNTIWAITLPYALPVFNMILMLNFFRQIPKEFEEAAFVDGANPFYVLVRIMIPCSLPAIATIGLFTIVFHWNAWFDGLIFMNVPANYPLMSYLQTVIIGLDFQLALAAGGEIDRRLFELSDRNLRAAQVMVATVPVLMVYPLLQKYFVKGIVLGGVKG